MKRKLALLLAAAMTLTLLPMNVFADSENSLIKAPTVVPEKSLLYEYNMNISNVPGPLTGNDNIKYLLDGTSIKIVTKQQTKTGDTFRVELKNAKFFFRGSNYAGWTTPTALEINQIPFSELYYANPSWNAGLNYAVYAPDTGIGLWNFITNDWVYDIFGDIELSFSHWATDGSTEKWNGSPPNNYNMVTGYGYDTYNAANGIWGYNTDINPNGNSAVTGTYYRYGDRWIDSNADPIASAKQIPYSLDVSQRGDWIGTVTVLNPRGFAYLVADTITDPDGVWITDQFIYPAGSEFIIPVVCRTLSGEQDVIAEIITDSNLTTVSQSTWRFSMQSGTGTNTYVNSPDDVRDSFSVDKLIIKEIRFNALKSGAYDSVEIKLPTGFEWRDPNALDSDGGRIVRVALERNIRWADGTTDCYGDVNAYAMKYVSLQKPGSSTYNDYPYYELHWKDIGGATTDTKYDKSVIVLTLRGLQPSVDQSGSVIITGLTFFADENAPWGDIQAQIKNVNIEEFPWSRTADMVTNQTFRAGTRVDWTISLKALEPIPQLVNGRLERENMTYAEDDHHKTATVVFSENSLHAWWSERETIFTLPEGVKFRKVEIVDAKEIVAADKALFERVYLNDGVKHDFVKIDGNTMTWNNLRINAEKTAKITMDIWVSVASGFVGDVTLSVAGSAIPGQGASNLPVPAAVIATQISPITITTKVTDLKIGYQYQQTQDILLTETKAGALLKGREVLVSVSDLVSTDMWFSPDVKIAVTAGDLKVSDIKVGSRGFASINNGSSLLGGAVITDGVTTGTTAGGNGGTISFIVKAPSSKASTITISNVSVKVDRTVPETNNRAYKVIAWGNGVANNYGYNKDEFNVPGVMAEYVKIISSATDKTSVLNQEVKVTVGEKHYTVNGVPYEMDAEAYISPVSESTMVPVRFISNAFGIRDDQVIWDDINKTVTVVTPQRVVQFTANSSTMLIDGVPVVMYGPEPTRLEVFAEIVNDRCYVPMRAMGEAFGIKVEWDATTKTAIYNPGASLLAVDTNTVPIPEEAPPTAPAQ